MHAAGAESHDCGAADAVSVAQNVVLPSRVHEYCPPAHQHSHANDVNILVFLGKGERGEGD